MSSKVDRITYIDQLVINWHMTEVCNYCCSYYSARWDQVSHERELLHNTEQANKLIIDLYGFFHLSNECNLLSKLLKWGSVRLNFKGGEPTLHKEKLIDLFGFTKEVGFDASIMTNGSMLRDRDFVKKLAKNLSIINVSIDSGRLSSNRVIGRFTDKFNICNVTAISHALNFAKIINSKLIVNINAVVNVVNFNENMFYAINTLKPDKWKVLRIWTNVINELSVTDKRFSGFTQDHNSLKHLIMLEPKERFFQNSSNIYSYSDKFLEVGTLRAFEQVFFRLKKFSKRYL